MYVTKEELAKAKEMDLLTYLMHFEPNNLKKESSKTYCTKDHDSLKISNGMWMWFSEGIGGRSALDYLIKVRGYTLPEAVKHINGQTVHVNFPDNQAVEKDKVIDWPEVSQNTDNVYWYLVKRGIHPEIIRYCIKNSLIYETEKHHNVLFAGYDLKENICYGSLRGTKGTFKGEVTGSNKKYTFKICDNSDASVVNVFESAIDLLSLISLKIIRGKDWKEEAYLSLGGVSGSNKLPVSLKHYLDNNNVREIRLYLDNDAAGKTAAKVIEDMLKDAYIVKIYVPKYKDVNEDLIAYINQTDRRKKHNGN